MKIEKNSAVTLRYKVTDLQGKLLDESTAPMVYLHGGYGNTFPKLEAALDGQAVGFQTVVELAAEDAFGVRDEGLMQPSFLRVSRLAVSWKAAPRTGKPSFLR